MTDNARIDEWKLIEQLREALGIFAEQASEFPADVPDLKQTNGWSFQVRDFRRAKNALDALARRSIQEQPDWPTERVCIPDPKNSDARIVGFRIREGDEAWGELGLSEPLFWLDRMLVASAPPPIARAGWKQGMEEAAEIVTKYALDEAQGGMKTILAQKMAKSIRNRIVAASPVPDNTDARGAQKESKQLALTPTDAPSSEAAAREDAGPVASRRLVEALIEISLLRVDLSEATDPFILFDKLNLAVKTARTALASAPAIIPGTDASAVIEQCANAGAAYFEREAEYHRRTPASRGSGRAAQYEHYAAKVRDAIRALDPVKAPKP